MNNASCCSRANTNQEKPSCCTSETSSCCGKETMTASGAIDPVCRMELDPSETKLTTEHEGETYYFCNIACKDSFVSNPEKYLGKLNQ